MIWPTPRPGLIIRYSYVLRRDAQAEGVKNRALRGCARSGRRSRVTRVYVLPITQSPPVSAAEAVEIPLTVKARLGLDGERSRVNFTEANVFAWPGPDLRPQPNSGASSAAY